MTVIAGLLFDKDGTLFDFSATWGGWTRRVVDVLSSRTGTPQSTFATLLGFDLGTGRFDDGSVVISSTTREIVDLILPQCPGETRERLLAELNQLASEITIVEAVPLGPLFLRLAGMGLKIGLATNDAEMPARNHLQQAGISQHFDFVAGFDSGWGGKPDTGQMQAFLRQTGLKPETVAMVGDSLHDLDAGRAAGMWTVAVLTGIAGRPVLAPHADVVLDDIGALPGWIASQS